MQIKGYRIEGELYYSTSGLVALLRGAEADFLRSDNVQAADFMKELAGDFERHGLPTGKYDSRL